MRIRIAIAAVLAAALAAPETGRNKGSFGTGARGRAKYPSPGGAARGGGKSPNSENKGAQGAFCGVFRKGMALGCGAIGGLRPLFRSPAGGAPA